MIRGLARSPDLDDVHDEKAIVDQLHDALIDAGARWKYAAW